MARPGRRGSARATWCTAVLLAGWALGSCSDAAGPDEPPPPSPEVVERGALVVCTELPYAPFVMEEDGEPTGFELDLLRRMADGLDLDLEVRPTPYASLVDGSALRDGRCDVAAGALLVTDEAAGHMDFVDPHYDVMLSLLVPSASDIDGMDDLAGLRIAVQQDTTSEEYAREHAPPTATVDVLAGDQYMFDALRNGRVDAVLQELSLNLAHTEGDQFSIVERYPSGEQYAFAVRPQADRLRRLLGRELGELRRDRVYHELHDEYFGDT